MMFLFFLLEFNYFLYIKLSYPNRKVINITKIKSITLDTWHKSEVDFMRSMGNFVHNARWAAFLKPGQGINSGSSMAQRDQFIRAKYEGKKEPQVGEFPDEVGCGRSLTDDKPTCR